MNNLPAALEAQAAAMSEMAAELQSLAMQLRATPAPAPRSLVSIEEACQLTGLSLFSVRRLLGEGALTEVRVGRRRMVARASLDALGEAS